jgi:hypothetical protein
MASTVRYQPPSNPEWALLVNKPELGTACERIAGKGKTIAEALSVDFTETGEYARSFDIQRSTWFTRGKPRAAADLVNTCDHAAFVELRHHVLSRTGGALGAL